jgi:peptidoglycan hydrolase-like protein with peptidoglycan-binding domain
MLGLVGLVSSLGLTPVAEAGDPGPTGGATYGVEIPLPTPALPPVAPTGPPPARPLQDGTQSEAIVAQAVTTLASHSLRPGSRGRLVLALQNLLQQAGLDVIVTGRFDTVTTREVRAFQRKHRMKVTGIVDPPTTTALATAAKAAVASAAPDAGWIFPLAPVAAVEPLGNWSLDQGVDLGGRSGDCGPKLLELAVADGTVVKIGVNGFGATAPVLRLTSGPDAGRFVYYGHAAPVLVKMGQQVVAGQPLAEVGCGTVGISSTPHLELGISGHGGGPCCPSWGETSHEAMTQLTYAYTYARAHPTPPPPIPVLGTPSAPGVGSIPAASVLIGSPTGGAAAAP